MWEILIKISSFGMVFSYDMQKRRWHVLCFIFFLTLVKDVLGIGKRLRIHRIGFLTTVTCIFDEITKY